MSISEQITIKHPVIIPSMIVDASIITRAENLIYTDIRQAIPRRLAKLMGLLALAFAWTYRTGELLHDGPSPIRQKNTVASPQVPLPSWTRLPSQSRSELDREDQ